MSLNKNSKDSQCTGGEKDWFHLLLEIERHFRAEERKNLRSEGETTPKLVVTCESKRYYHAEAVV